MQTPEGLDRTSASSVRSVAFVLTIMKPSRARWFTHINVLRNLMLNYKKKISALGAQEVAKLPSLRDFEMRFEK